MKRGEKEIKALVTDGIICHKIWLLVSIAVKKIRPISMRSLSAALNYDNKIEPLGTEVKDL